jgi:hypothetical protein
MQVKGYVPNDLGIGGGSYIEFSYCLYCGQIQDIFPLDQSELELEENAADDGMPDEEIIPGDLLEDVESAFIPNPSLDPDLGCPDPLPDPDPSPLDAGPNFDSGQSSGSSWDPRPSDLGSNGFGD